MIAKGDTTKEIVVKLSTSAKAIDKHHTHMMEKLGLHDAVAVTRYAIRNGLVYIG